MSLDLLKQLADEDQKDHGYNPKEVNLEHMAERDAERVAVVTQLLSTNKPETIEDFHNAALIYIHGNMQEHVEKALELAKEALNLGQPVCLNLGAKAYDKLVSFWQKKEIQRFGTQFFVNDDKKVVPIPCEGTVPPQLLNSFGFLDCTLYTGKPLTLYLQDREVLTNITLEIWNELDDNEKAKLTKLYRSYLEI